MKLCIWFTTLLFIMGALTGCKTNDSNPTDDQIPSVVATESWNAIMDNDSLNHGQHSFEKKSDGVITTKGTWYYAVQGTEVVCPFSEGYVVITDTVVKYTANGTATNTAAPAGYQTSPFTFYTQGVAKNGKAYGNYTISFSTIGWPNSIEGTFTSVRASGSGITK